MSYKIADCCISERGTIDGNPGDNNGREYKYKTNPYKWQAVYEWKQKYIDDGTAKLFSQLAKQAADNESIGYSQPRRLTFYVKLKKAGWSPKLIKEKCDSDCSASTATLLVAVGYLKGISALKSIEKRLKPGGLVWTGNLDSVLMATGCFTRRREAKYISSTSQYVKQGSICLSHVGGGLQHVTIACTNGEKVVTTAPTKTLTAIAKEVIDGKWGNGDARKKKLAAAGYDYAKVQAEVNRLLKK